MWRTGGQDTDLFAPIEAALDDDALREAFSVAGTSGSIRTRARSVT